MTNYLTEAASTAAANGYDSRMDRRTKKPVMEKQRRDRMNRAMDDLKAYLLKYDPAHSSKLEKADILERTCELLRRMEMERSSSNSRLFVEGFLRGSSEVCLHLKTKSASPEVQRLISDVMVNMRPPVPPHFNVALPPLAGMPNPPGVPPPPMVNVNGQLVRPIIPPPSFFMGFPGMPMAMPLTPTKFPSAAPPLTPDKNNNDRKPETMAVKAIVKTESSYLEEDVDVENVDDDTYSDFTSPETSVRTLKRKFFSTDDSGFSEPSPKRMSPGPLATASTHGAFSIDSLLISKD